MKNNNDTSREELEAMLKRAILDGLSNHTGEFANPWIFKGSYSHELLADILNDIMASERLFKNLQNLIDQHTKTMCERARIDELERIKNNVEIEETDDYDYPYECLSCHMWMKEKDSICGCEYAIRDRLAELQSSSNKREDSDE